MKKFCSETLAALLFAAAIVLVGLSAARAEVVVQIDKSSQRMTVSVDGAMRYSWPISTGRALVERNGPRNTTIEISN